MKLSRLLSVCALAVLMVLSVAQAQTPKKLRFATEGAFPPWNWTEPDGTLAGFCVGWHEPARGVAQLEPVGVHPRYQRRGLSRALLTEMLHRLKVRGASVAIADTELDQTAARAAYDAVGFKQTHTIWRQEAWATDVS